MAKRQKIENIPVPIVTCPKCSGNCYSKQIEVICEKCNEDYDIDTGIFGNGISFVLTQSEELSRYMKYLLQEKKRAEKEEAVDENNIESFSVVYKGQILDVLKKMKLDNGFSTLLFAVKYITEGFFFVFNQMRQLPGEKIFLVDDLGNKSVELKKGFLRNTYTSFNRDKDRTDVENFIRSLVPKPKDTQTGEKGE